MFRPTCFAKSALQRSRPRLDALVSAPAARLLALAAFGLATIGCSQNPLLMKQQLASVQQQNATLLAEVQELKSRASSLDRDHQELESILAQERQRVNLVEDQRQALQEQLADLASELDRSRGDLATSEQRVDALAASTRRRVGATITPNSSLDVNLPRIDIPGVQLRRDGDLVRIEIGSDGLFSDAMAQLLLSAPKTLDAVAAKVRETYPDQRIVVEGHTDQRDIRGQYPNNHQLSVARATAVYEYLVGRGGLSPVQLSIAGYGASQPVVSNASDAGQKRNRRIELVVYPQRVAGR